MGKNGWKQFFSTTILQRGHDYFERGLVENLHCDGGEVTAEVHYNL